MKEHGSAIPASDSALQGARLLLADDHTDFTTLVRNYLHSRGAVLDIAVNGAEALKKALADDYDLILVDIQMPEMDGYQLTRELRGHGFSRPIIAVTAYAMTPYVEAARQAGADAVLTKPVSLPMLKDAVLERLGPH